MTTHPTIQSMRALTMVRTPAWRRCERVARRQRSGSDAHTPSAAAIAYGGAR